MLYRPRHGDSANVTLKINGESLGSAVVPAYTTLKPAATVRGVLATPTMQYTDRLASESDARSFRTARVVFMLYDEDHRPRVASTSLTLILSGIATRSTTCAPTRSSDLHHTCSLELLKADFPPADAHATKTRTKRYTVVIRSIDFPMAGAIAFASIPAIEWTSTPLSCAD